MSQTTSLPKLCLVTPWPPQHTGIADYAYDLAAGLVCQGCDVTVVTEAEPPRPLPGVTFHTPDWLTSANATEFDRIVYQIGNNSNFHIFQLPLLAQYPGVVHLHDLVLHHLMAWILYENGSPLFYRSALAKWYGPEISARVWDMLRAGQFVWDSPAVMQLPFFEEVLQYATGLITNSSSSATRVHQAFPTLPRYTLPQLYQGIVQHQGSGDLDLHIGVLGGIDPNKRIDLVWNVVAKLLEDGFPVHLHLAGSISAPCQPLISRMQASPYAERVHIHGRVDDAELVRLVSTLDICVALRYPSMGETSAIVMRAMQAATPVIVNQIGWYAELPEFVPKIVPGHVEEEEMLFQMLANLSDKGRDYQLMRSAFAECAANNFHFESAIKNYADFCLRLAKK